MSELAILLSMHGIAIAAGVLLMLLALNESAGDSQAESADGDGDGGIRRPGDRPRGGPPLPRSGQSRVRLREPGRLADHHASRPRRGPVEPRRPRAPARCAHTAVPGPWVLAGVPARAVSRRPSAIA